MKKILFSLPVAVLFLFGCAQKEILTESSETVQTAVSEESASVEGVLQVKITEDMASLIETDGVEAVLGSLSGIGAYEMERIFKDSGEMEARQREAGLHLWYSVKYREPSSTKAVSEVNDRFEGITVEIPRKVKLTSLPFNDPFASQQWNLYNDGKFVPGSVKGIDINVLPVWEYTAGSTNVIVNVVDDGVSTVHPDIGPVVIPGGKDGSKNFVTDSYDITASLHGTHVAGIIAGISNNGLGISGIAGGKDGKGGVRILSSQIFQEDRKTGDSSAASDVQTAAAIVWGADHGALISQNSWGYVYPTEEMASKGEVSKLVKEAIDYFIRYAGCDAQGKQVGLMKGGLVLFAAGNDNFAYGIPANYEPVIAVGALDPKGRKATYSNYGPWVDICAPGGDYEAFGESARAMIVGPAYESDYYYAEGTSMACPHVSGVAALMVSLYGGPGFTCDSLKRMILNGANYNYGVKDNIGPMLDANGAMLVYQKEKTPVIKSSYSGDYVVKGHDVLEVNYSIVSSNKVLEISVECDSSAQYAIVDRTVTVRYNDASGNQSGSHKLKIRAESGSGLKTEQEIEYTILENHAPVVARQAEDRIIRLSGSSCTVDMSTLFSDPDGGPLEYSYSTAGSSVVSITIAGSRLGVKYFNNGIETITVSATDPCGKSCSQSFRVGCYDDSNAGPAAYPNPVTDRLNICVGGDSQTTVTVYSSAGALLYETSAKCSVLDPVVVDMGAYAPGRYRVTIEYDGKVHTKDIVKL